jgi:hypothetical protein
MFSKSNIIPHFKKTTAYGMCVVVLAIAGVACSGTRSNYLLQQKYSAAALQQDLEVARSTYMKNHPAIDWYNSKDSINQRFERVKQSITDSLTEPEFRVLLSYAIEAIRCGHTSVLSSKAYVKYNQKNPAPQFPFEVRFWGKDSLIVVRSLLKDSFALPPGTAIKSIGGASAGELIAQMKQYVSTDGFSDGFKDIIISNSFGARLKWMYGPVKQYKISYIDSLGAEREKIFPNYQPKKPGYKIVAKDSASIAAMLKSQKDDSTGLFAKNFRQLKTKMAGTWEKDSSLDLSVFTLNTFSSRKVDGIIRRGFKNLSKSGHKNLVIDLRNNGGGKINNSTLLTRYLIDKPFRVADSASAVSLKLAYPRYTQASWVYKYFRWAFTSRQADGRYHLRTMERRYYKPKRKHHFNGNVFVITAGGSFSASSLFLSKVVNQPNVITVGEETGGGARGNSAIMTPQVTLPNTRVRIRLPLFKLVSDAAVPDIGRGIIPKQPVPPNSWFIKTGQDPKMAWIKDYLKQKKQ